MNKHEGVVFLFKIAKGIRRSFENPIILVTLKDHGDYIFNSLVDMRTALLQNASSERVAEIVKTFHIEWLQAVQDIDNFKRRINSTPREIVLRALDFSIECVKNRLKYFQKYTEHLHSTMTVEEKRIMQTEINSMHDLCDIVTSALIEKKKYLLYQSDQSEFHDIVADEVEDLMEWLDSMNDFLVSEFSKTLDLVPQLPDKLSKTSRNIIDKVVTYLGPEEKIASNISDSSKGKMTSAVTRLDYIKSVHINKIVDKIKNLEKRINQHKTNDLSVLPTLKHKTIHLEEKLKSLHNLKTSLDLLINRHSGECSYEATMQNKELHFFYHMLPHKQRCRLVDKLVKLWDNAIRGDRSGKSIISILSVTDMKEIFYDDLGQFTVDKYGRKIYTKEADDTLYQSNEENQLIALQDDEKHVYFYDDCGRYYLNETRRRVYKAHESASEYILQRDGIMLKVKEEKDGIEYQYDSLGRYCVNGHGEQIYRDEDSTTEYEHDGFGNLVRLSSDYKRLNDIACPTEPMVMEESKYLKKTIGDALKKCLADVVLTQPEDPIDYLANCLEKYRYNVEARQQLSEKEKEIMIERELYTAAIKTTPVNSYINFEESVDYNFTDYANFAEEF